MLGFLTSILDLPVYQAIVLSAIGFGIFVIIRYYIEKLQIDNLSRRPVFITGCDTGFGRLLAIKCLEQGMPVFAGCLTQQGIDDLNSNPAAKKGDLDAFLMNVADEQSVIDTSKHVEEKVEKYGGLHAVVNNAGITGRSVPDDFLRLDEYRRVIDINVYGVVQTTQCLKNSIKKARGRVVNVASICGRVGLPGLSPYCISKFGVNGYTDVLRTELRPFGVSVHVLEPGFFNTPILGRDKVDREIQEAWEKASEDVKEQYGLEYFKQTRQALNRFLNLVANDNLMEVVDTYFHAITAQYPRSRYQCGWDSALVFAPFSYLPTGIQDIVWSLIGILFPKPASV